MDAAARIVARKMSALLRQPLIIENKAGGAESAGILVVTRAQADGYTLLICSNGGTTINQALYKNLSYDAQKDLMPLGRLGASPLLIAVGASEPYKDLAELVAYSKTNPTKLFYGTPGTGQPHHLAMEFIKGRTGISAQHVPYRGAASSVSDLLAGVIPIAVATLPAVESNIKAGNLRGLVVLTGSRLPQLPDVPTIGELLPNVVIDLYSGLYAPAGIPASVAAKLADAVKSTMHDLEVKEQLDRIGYLTSWASGEDLAAIIAFDRIRWDKVIQDIGLKPE